jgi:hypothetical protein
MSGELWQLKLSLDATTIEGRMLLPLAECVASLRTNNLGHIDRRAFVLNQTHSLMNEKEKV